MPHKTYVRMPKFLDTTATTTTRPSRIHLTATPPDTHRRKTFAPEVILASNITCLAIASAVATHPSLTGLVTATLLSTIACAAAAVVTLATFIKAPARTTLYLFASNISLLFWYWISASRAAAVGFDTPAYGYYPHFSAGTPNDVVAKSLVATNLFTVALAIIPVVFRHPFRVAKKLACRRDIISPPLVTPLAAASFVTLAWLVYLVLYNYNLASMTRDFGLIRASGRTGFTNDAGLSRHFLTLGAYGGALAAVQLIQQNYPGKLLNLLTSSSMAVLFFFSQGSRFQLGYILLPPLIATLPRFREWKGRRRGFILSAGLTAIVFFIIAFQAHMRMRGFSSSSAVGTLTQMSRDPLSYTSDDQFSAILAAVDMKHRYQKDYFEDPLFFFPIHFIPREVWPNKPVPASYEDYNREVVQGARYNVTPSCAGQYYLLYGTAGPLLGGIVLGLILKFSVDWLYSSLVIANTFRISQSLTVGGMLVAFFFFSFRYFHPLYFQYPAFGFIAYLLLTVRAPIPPSRSSSFRAVP